MNKKEIEKAIELLQKRVSMFEKIIEIVSGNKEEQEIENEIKSYKIALSALQQQLTNGWIPEQKESCEYILIDDDSNVWECNQCGEPWMLSAGTPKDNNMNYCPKCGRILTQPTTDN